MSVTKTHTGDFARGGQGVYRVTVTNTGDESTTGDTVLVDNLPQGLTLTGLDIVSTDTGLACNGGPGGQSVQCESGALFPDGSYTVDFTVNVAADAPCSVTHTATVTSSGVTSDSASDPTTITGGSCDDGEGGGGLLGPILPVNLSGIIPMFNNITTNNAISSPGATNNSSQALHVSAP